MSSEHWGQSVSEIMFCLKLLRELMWGKQK